MIISVLSSCADRIIVNQYNNFKYGGNSIDTSLAKFKIKDFNKVERLIGIEYKNEFIRIKELVKLKGVDEPIDNSIYNFAFVYKNDTIYTNALKSKDSSEYNHLLKCWKFNNKVILFQSDVFTREILD